MLETGTRSVTGWRPPVVFVDSLNEAPDAPVLSAPADTTEVDELRPTLTVGNATDPENDTLTYTVELYLDEGLTALALSVTDVPETTATTSFILTEDLVEDQRYHWRVRANDGELDGAWMPAASFRVNTANHGPSSPTPLSPIAGRVASVLARAHRDARHRSRRRRGHPYVPDRRHRLVRLARTAGIARVE